MWRVVLVAWVLGVGALGAARAHADDWLALYPECAFGAEARALGRTTLIYPRPGLSAVVSSGERLVSRVRIASGLTPPPGVQQEGALRGWSAELVGQSVALGGPSVHRYPVRVVDVRPDGVSSLVYRATVIVPAWAAPGTYGLRMTTPGGSVSAAGAVRVRAPDAPPLRLALLAPEVTANIATDDEARALLETLATMPVDVFVSGASASFAQVIGAAPIDAALPAWVAVPAAAALRVGNEALVLGECDDRLIPFAEQLAGIAAREHREPRTLSLDDFPPTSARVSSGGDASSIVQFRRGGGDLLEIPPSASLTRSIEGDAVHLSSTTERELSVVFPVDGRGIACDGGAMRLYPATDVPTMGAVLSVVARITVPARRAVTVTRIEPRPLSVRIERDPEAPKTRELTRFTAVVDGEATLVAWRLGEDDTFVGREIEERFGAVGDHEAFVMVIGTDGAMAEAHAPFTIETRDARGCGASACAIAAPAPAGRNVGILELWLLGVLLLQRGGRRGNSPRRDNR